MERHDARTAKALGEQGVRRIIFTAEVHPTWRRGVMAFS
jgi:hypothetical protein